MCATCETVTTRHEDVCVLRQRPARQGCGKTDLLQQGVLSAEASVAADWRPELGALARAQRSDGDRVRTLREDDLPTGASPGPGPVQQRAEQPRDALHVVPQQGAPHSTPAVHMRGLRWGVPSEVPPFTREMLLCPVCQGLRTHLLSPQVGPSRVGALRGYGNAIVPRVAAEFIKAFMEGQTEHSAPHASFRKSL